MALANDAWAVSVSSAGKFGVPRRARLGYKEERP